MSQKLTIFIVGPPKVGKTAIANYLADLTDSLNGDVYHPTQGVRILEFEKLLSQSKGKDISIAVEAWDCSGDPSFMSVWPAVASSASAVVFVCTPEKKQDKDLEAWYSMFSFLNPTTQMCIFYNKIGAQGANLVKIPKPKFGKVLSKIPVYHTNFADENDTSRSDFETLLFTAYNAHHENREREEHEFVTAIQSKRSTYSSAEFAAYLDEQKGAIAGLLDYFTAPSGTARPGGEKAGEAAFVSRFSAVAQLSETQSVALLRAFVAAQLRGNKQVLLDYTDATLDALLVFYYDERSAHLASTAALLRAASDATHPFYAEIASLFATPFSTQLATAAENQLLPALQRRVPPRLERSPHRAQAWAAQNLKEQRALLEILFLVYYDPVRCKPKHAAAIVDLLDQARFALDQPNAPLFDESAHQTWREVSHLCILLTLTVLNLEDVGASAGDDAMTEVESGDKEPALTECTNHLYELSKLFAKYSHTTNPSEGAVLSPLLLAWGSILQRISGTPSAEKLQQDYGIHASSASLKFIQAANDFKVFESLVHSIKSYTHSDNHLNSVGYKSVLKGLLKLFIQCFNVDDTPKFNDLAECFIQIFTDCPEIAEQFWIQDYPLDDCRSLLDAARARFPYEQRTFVRLLGSLCENETTAAFVFEYLKQVQTFTGPFEDSMVHTGTGGVTTLAREYDLAQGASSRFPLYAVRGCPVRILSVNPPVLHIHVSYSAFHLFISHMDAFLETAGEGVTGPAATGQTKVSCEVMSDWLHLINNLLLNANADDAETIMDHLCELPGSVRPLDGFNARDLAATLCRVFSRACLLDTLPTQLLTVCLKTLAILLPTQPGVWSLLRQEMPIPRYTNDAVAVTVSGRYMQQRLLPYERSIGVYATTLAFLELVLVMVRQCRVEVGGGENVVQAEVVASCVKYIHAEIFPTYGSWRFARLGDKLSIGFKVLQIYNLVLRDFTVTKTSPTLSTLRHFLLQNYLNGSLFQLSPLLTLLGSGVDSPVAFFRALKHREGTILQDSIAEALQFVKTLLMERKRGEERNCVLEHAILDHTVKSEEGDGRGGGGGKEEVRELVHVVALYSSYEYCLEIPRLSAEVLILLCSVASEWTPRPPSFIGYFGSDALPIVSYFVTLAGDTDLDNDATQDPAILAAKESIQRTAIDFVTVVVQTQPGLGTMFLEGTESVTSLSTPVGGKKLGGTRGVSKKDAIPSGSILSAVTRILKDWKSFMKLRPTVVPAVLRLLCVLWKGASEFQGALARLRRVDGFWDALWQIFAAPTEAGEGVQWLDVCRGSLYLIFANEVFHAGAGQVDAVVLKAVKKVGDLSAMRRVFESGVEEAAVEAKKRLSEVMQEEGVVIDLEVFEKPRVAGLEDAFHTYGEEFWYDVELLEVKGAEVLETREGRCVVEGVRELNGVISKGVVDVVGVKGLCCFLKIATFKLGASVWAGGNPAEALVKVCTLVCEILGKMDDFSVQRLQVCAELSSLLTLLLNLWAKEVAKPGGAVKSQLVGLAPLLAALETCVSNPRFREFVFSNHRLAHSFYNQIWTSHLVVVRAITEMTANGKEEGQVTRMCAEFCCAVLPYAVRPLEQILAAPMQVHTAHHSIVLTSLVMELVMFVDQTGDKVDSCVGLLCGSDLVSILINFVCSVGGGADSNDLFELEFLNCEAALQLLLQCARVKELSDCMVSNGLMASFCNSVLSQQVVESGIAGYIGQDRNAVHRLWCLMVKVVSAVLRRVSDPQSFQWSVVGFLKMHWTQVQGLLGAPFETVLNCGALEEMECFTELMSGMVAASVLVEDGDVDDAFVGQCREVMVHVYRQSVYFLRHPGTLKARAVYMGREDIEGVTSVGEKEFHDVFVNHVKALVLLIDRNVVSFLCVAFNVEACLSIGDTSRFTSEGLTMSTLCESLAHACDTLSKPQTPPAPQDLVQQTAFDAANLCLYVSQVMSLILCFVIASPLTAAGSGEEGRRRDAEENLAQTKNVMEVMVREGKGGQAVKEAVKEIERMLERI
ncbi:hypothetical protein HDU98_007585 [Podochytrium sp. JEL0797]|nr:hypothetical protein HDU98_007585 [Podochytrium sp. JEL0797]